MTFPDDQDEQRVIRDLDHIHLRPKLEPPPNRKVPEPTVTAVEGSRPVTPAATEEEIEELVPEFMRKDFYRSQEMEHIPPSIEIRKPVPPPSSVPEAPKTVVQEAPVQKEEEPEEDAEDTSPLWKWLGLMFVILAIFFLGDYLASDLQEPKPEFTGVPLNQVAEPIVTPNPEEPLASPSPRSEELISPSVSDPEPAVRPENQVEPPPRPEPMNPGDGAPPRPGLSDPPPRVSQEPPPPSPAPETVPDRPWRMADPAPARPTEPPPKIEYILPEPPL